MTMKKTIIILIVLGLAGYGWMHVRSARIDFGIFGGKQATIGRGDLSIAITATGEIQPKRRIEIKPEASGTIAEIPKKAGDMVDAGELIIVLDPEDEQRSVDRSTRELERAKATLAQARLKLMERESTALDQIQARIDGIQAQLDEAEFRYQKVKRLRERDQVAADEYIQAKARRDNLAAQLAGLKADGKQAEIAIELARRDVELAENAFSIAETNLKDARERLEETRIRAPIDGMVTDVRKGEGEVVQGGKTTITGGTVLAVVADVSEIFVRTEVFDSDIGAVMWLAPPDARPGGSELSEELQAAGVLEESENVGTPVKIVVDAFRDEVFSGVIERIFPEPRKAQNIITYLVDIRVDSPNRGLLKTVMGMQADVEFTSQFVEDAILVPHDAIRRGPTGDLGVYVEAEPTDPEETPRPEFVPCRFGLDNGLYAELVSSKDDRLQSGISVYTELPPKFANDEDDTTQ